jgi:hypothetical protein
MVDGKQQHPVQLILNSKAFVTIDLINKFSEHGSGSLAPHCDEKDHKHNSVANKKSHSTALGRLEK